MSAADPRAGIFERWNRKRSELKRNETNQRCTTYSLPNDSSNPESRSAASDVTGVDARAREMGPVNRGRRAAATLIGLDKRLDDNAGDGTMRANENAARGPHEAPRKLKLRGLVERDERERVERENGADSQVLTIPPPPSPRRRSSAASS
ncbi:hypothetical protein AMAG_18567 [Allomyces macrogynus ATCC 38327]|uniref:Uncharacterized protein n=1 Tax=Allomyces macrogynus (strain ATCC 38327) TaxID=578462 RepID=A0A0L0SDI1_ALLM3|nr:hypothetical protein AMAG_18567 [Allomyces macrogynus ATCC 38327]|eukprot:KNE60613.1 hypothetical protein AMAG_18567 [Allomyces macrogynus ATCC 38327]